MAMMLRNLPPTVDTVTLTRLNPCFSYVAGPLAALTRLGPLKSLTLRLSFPPSR